MVTAEIDKLDQVYADDFATVGSSGKVITKENLLNPQSRATISAQVREACPLATRRVVNLCTGIYSFCTGSALRNSAPRFVCAIP